MHRTEGANNVAGLYTAGPPPTTITADALNSIQEEIANVVEYSGQAIQTAATDTRDQLLAAVLALIPTYDAVVTSQASWDALIERTGANTYQFKDAYSSIFAKVGSYTLTLSGGDTWGQLQTNNVTHLEFERGAAIQFGNTPGYLHINTGSSYFKNVHVKGLGTVASAATYCFYISVGSVTLDNCQASLQLSNTNITGFYDNAGSALNKYSNCHVEGLTSSGNVTGFYNCNNLSNCDVYNLDATGAGIINGFSTCTNLNNCRATTLDSVNGVCHGFYACNQISSSKASDLDTSGIGEVYGFRTCNQISACIATDIQCGNGGESYGYSSCAQLSGCIASLIDSTSTDPSYGYNSCNRLSACYANDIDSVDGLAYGFASCNYMAACTANDIDESGTGSANGFNTCMYAAAIYTDEALNSACSYIDSNDAQITVKWSVGDYFT